IGSVAGARETVGSTVVQKSRIQCYNCKEFRHVARKCQKPKRVKDAAYHREKMLLYQELEAHYMYMAKLQEVSPDAVDSGPIFDAEPLQKIDQNDDDADLVNERELLSSLIEKLKCEIDESKNRNKFLQTSNKVLIEKLKAPESDEVIRLEKEIRSKLSDLIRPFDYDKLNNLYDLTNMPIAMPVSTRDPKHTVKQSNGKPLKKTVASESNQKPRNITRKLYERVSKACSWWYPKFTPSGYKWKPKSDKENLVEIVLFIVNSGCSKHMMGNLKLLINFVEKFMRTVKFKNKQIAPILGYGDLIQGAVTIKQVYYVEGLNHNLFSVGQFCDADLEVAFRKSTCYIRDLKGNDLLTGSRGTDLYSMTLQATNYPNLICLMAKATSSEAWLWHRCLSHLNFDTINLLLKNDIVNDIVVGLPKLKFIKDHLCSSCELRKAKRKSFHTKLIPSSKRRSQLLHMDLCGPMQVASINGKRYVLVIIDDYSRYT
nr:retrovirus-related Pol polyprotein from transposon TNT 1-94 [Tanacetum cinerariifolium]